MCDGAFWECCFISVNGPSASFPAQLAQMVPKGKLKRLQTVSQFD